MFGTRPLIPPSGVLPHGMEGRLLPRPRRMALDGDQLKLSRRGLPVASLACDPASRGHEAAAVDWLRRELRLAHGWKPAPAGPGVARIVVGVSRPGTPAGELVERSGLTLPTASESYIIRIRGDIVALLATEGDGLLRGVTTLAQLLGRDADGELCVACGEIDDWPELAFRMLTGWGLYRSWRLREVIDFAFRYKYNRVLYNWWNWTAQEHLTAEDRWMAGYARSLGIELSLELRRLSFGDGFDGNNPEHVGRILAVYDEAIDAGFRRFGIMYDDQTFQPVEAEIAVVRAILAHLRDRTGEEAEFTFCQRVYWLPGELPGWPPEPGRAEEFRRSHAEYLATIGAALPENVLFYLANNWLDYPSGYASEQERGFNAPSRRKPIFFDNQVANDPRRSVIVPFPVHNRAPEFARACAGYAPNSPVPIVAGFPVLMTCAALAWNPAGYDPPTAWGAAIWQHFGADRSAKVLDCLNALNSLVAEWTAPMQPSEEAAATEWQRTSAALDSLCHYWRLRNRLAKGMLLPEQVRGWRRQLSLLAAGFADALSRPGEGTEALFLYVEEMHRLDLDMAVVQDILSTRDELRLAPREEREAILDAHRARQEGFRRRVLDIVARRMPPARDIQMLLHQPDGTYLFPKHTASQMPGWWWVNFFYETVRSDLEAIQKAGEEVLASFESEEAAGGAKG